MRLGLTKHATKLQPHRTVNNRDISISAISMGTIWAIQKIFAYKGFLQFVNGLIHDI